MRNAVCSYTWSIHQHGQASLVPMHPAPSSTHTFTVSVFNIVAIHLNVHRKSPGYRQLRGNIWPRVPIPPGADLVPEHRPAAVW